MKLLTIVAHPDDAAIFCGGTLAKHADNDNEVHVAYMSRGRLGGTGEMKRSEVAKTRVQEAKEAGDQMGVSTSFLEFKDGRIENSLQSRLKINEVIRRHSPDLVITHDMDDDHPDHRKTAQLVTDAYYHASQPLVDSEYESVEPRNLYYFGKRSSDFEPEYFVKIDNYQKRKEKAIRSHQSQLEFLEEHGGLDRNFDELIEGIRAEARGYGRKAGVRYAEGFIRLHTQANDYLE